MLEMLIVKTQDYVNCATYEIREVVNDEGAKTYAPRVLEKGKKTEKKFEYLADAFTAFECATFFIKSKICIAKANEESTEKAKNKEQRGFGK